MKKKRVITSASPFFLTHINQQNKKNNNKSPGIKINRNTATLNMEMVYKECSMITRMTAKVRVREMQQ